MKKPHFAAAIFDLDGTLLDTLADLANACNQALTDFGVAPVAFEHYRQLVGQGARNLVSTAVRLSHPEWTEEQIDPIFKAYRRHYATGWHRETAVYPGIYPLLEQLQAAQVKLAVLSNKPDDSTQLMLRHYFPGNPFSVAYGQLEDFPIKPDPALARHIAAKLGADPAQVALIGDSGSDMRTAVNAGMAGIGVLWGFRDADELTTGGASALAGEPAALARILLDG
jgi:phosphoglycolate phosphatase